MSRRAVLTTVTDPVATDTVFQPTLDTSVLTQGEQTYIDKVKELEERYAKPNKKKKRKTKSKKSVKNLTKSKRPRKKAFQLSQVIKGRHGIPITKATTFKSLIRHVRWGKKPLLELLNKRVRLVEDHFLNKRTSLLSLVRSIPMAKVPLVDVIVSNKLV